MPRQQIGLYHNLDQLITCGKEIASVHGQEWPETDMLVSCLFDFDLAPVSYSNSAKSTKEHRFAFIETIWDQIPVIIQSSCKVGGSVGEIAVHLGKIWRAVISPSEI
jgi:hypothetical protein